MHPKSSSSTAIPAAGDDRFESTRAWSREIAGGGKRAAQPRPVLEGLNMKPVATMPGPRLGRDRVLAGAIDAASAFEGDLPEPRQAAL